MVNLIYDFRFTIDSNSNRKSKIVTRKSKI